MTAADLRRLGDAVLDISIVLEGHERRREFDRAERDLAQLEDLHRELGVALRDARLTIEQELRKASQSTGTHTGGP